MKRAERERRVAQTFYNRHKTPARRYEFVMINERIRFYGIQWRISILRDIYFLLISLQNVAWNLAIVIFLLAGLNISSHSLSCHQNVSASGPFILVVIIPFLFICVSQQLCIWSLLISYLFIYLSLSRSIKHFVIYAAKIPFTLTF